MHLSRLNAPRVWALKRKSQKWATRVRPGAHAIEKSIPLGEIVKYLVGSNSRESKIILNNGSVIIDGIVRKDTRFAVGLMDIVNVPNLGKWFRVLFDRKGRLILKEIYIKDTSEAEKFCKITGKITLKKGMAQINLFDGKNILIDAKKAKEFRLGDTLVFGFGKDKNKFFIKRYIKLEKDSTVYLSGGKYIGNIGILTKIEADKAFFKLNDKEQETKKESIFVIDKTFELEQK